MKKTIYEDSKSRLAQTPEGKVLLDLISYHGNPTELAARIGIKPQLVRQWVYNTRVSRHGAKLIEKVLGIPASEVRPDLPASTWEEKQEEQKIERQPVARNSDAKMLVRVSEKLGGIQEFCDAVGCTRNDYHNWKARGRIPAIKLPTILALR